VTSPLSQETHVVGRHDFHIFVSAGAANAYYFAELIERDSNGNDHLVSRGAFKDTSSGFASPHEIDFSGFGVNRVFNAGNSIGLRIASRDFPFFLANKNQPTIKFYRRPPNASNLTLPIVP
jgi:predicted acyl esterase